MRFIVPLVAILMAGTAAEAAVRVPLNQATRVSLRGQAADVIVGNPAIADVNVLDGRTVYLVGKQSGVTNLVVLDGAGRTIFSDTVVVGSVGGGGSSDTVTIARGRSIQDVSCSPVCVSVAPAPSESATAPAPPLAVAPAQAAPSSLPAAPAGASSGAAALGGSSPR